MTEITRQQKYVAKKKQKGEMAVFKVDLNDAISIKKLSFLKISRAEFLRKALASLDEFGNAKP